MASEVRKGRGSETEKKLWDFLDIRGETAARRPLLALDLRISFSCQEKGRGGIKNATKWQVMVPEVRKGRGSGTAKKLCVFLNIRGETAARRPLLALNLRIPFSCQEKGREGIKKRTTKWQVMVS